MSILAFLVSCVFATVVANTFADGSSNETACSAATETSSGFRVYLPDCRSYEMVTPPYKEGAQIFPEARSVDGLRLMGQSLAAIVGASNLEALPAGFDLGAPYEFERTISGWRSISLNPPASEFPRSALIFPSLSPDLERGLWLLSPSTQPEGEYGLYLRNSNGIFELIGPTHAPNIKGSVSGFKFGGISNDSSHVVFSRTAGGFWPGDTTVGERSLYEYVGTNNSEPMLVGVKNDGQLHGIPLNHEAQLISQCGTYLGSERSGDTYNAVSDDGKTVYFTAGIEGGCKGVQPSASELYARVDGEKTVAISSPSHPLAQGSGTGANECDPACEGAIPGKGIFQGASHDGSKVFFLTEQPLLNGDTDSTTDLYEAEIEGHGQNAKLGKLVQVSHGEEAANVQGVARVSENGSHVYFVATGKLTKEADQSLKTSHQVAVSGGNNLYSYDTVTHHLAFVATLSSVDQADWSTEDIRPVQANLCSPAEEAGNSCEPGRFLVFASAADLTEGDTSSVRQIFEYDAETGTLIRISVGAKIPGGYECSTTKRVEEGFNCSGNTSARQDSALIPTSVFVQSFSPSESNSNLTVSDNGSNVFFSSVDGLTPQALNNQPIGEENGGAPVYAYNAYEYRGGNVYLISDGRDTKSLEGASTTRLLGTDGSGEDAFFTTSGQLVPQDTDTEMDIYDAREQGGFLAPASSSSCTADGCQQTSTGPSLLAAGSVFQTWGGNLAPPPAREQGPKSLTRTQKLSHALRACAKERRKRRRSCESQARKQYGRRK